jgi:hypothetical protein
MTDENAAWLQYFGYPFVDVVLMGHFRQTYDIEFMVNKDKINTTKCVTWMINWDYCDTTHILNDYDKFIEELNHGTTRRFLAIFLRINTNHSNVIILDNKLKVIHFFEPNAARGEKNPVYDHTRDYFTQLIMEHEPYKSYTKGLRWTNIHHMFQDIGKFYPELHNLFYVRGCCVHCCWYYILKVVKEEDISKGDWFDILQTILGFTKYFQGYESDIYNYTMQIDTIRKLLLC